LLTLAFQLSRFTDTTGILGLFSSLLYPCRQFVAAYACVLGMVSCKPAAKAFSASFYPKCQQHKRTCYSTVYVNQTQNQAPDFQKILSQTYDKILAKITFGHS